MFHIVVCLVAVTFFTMAFGEGNLPEAFEVSRERAEILRPCCLYKSFNQVGLCGSDETQKAFYTMKFVQDIKQAMDDESTVGSLNTSLSVFIGYRK